MEIFFPAQTLPLFQVFAPCFTAPSFAYFQSYVWALMVVEGRKCLTRLARCAFFHQRDLSSWERFLAVHRWSLTALTKCLVTLVVTKLGDQLQVHGAYLLGTDTTLVAKTAKRMLGVQTWKDHSDNADRGGYLVGHHWNLVGLLSPWGTRWLCWPLVMRLVPGLQGARQWLVGAAVTPMSFWDAAIAAILEVTRCLGDASVRVVVLEGAKEPYILVSTDLTLSALQIIEIYGARFSIELTIRDLKQHFGLGDSQCTTTLAILRFVHLACLAFCLWRLALLEHLDAGWLQVTSARVSLPEAPLSFQRVRRALRAWATRQIIFANSAPGADLEKIERDHEPLLHMLI